MPTPKVRPENGKRREYSTKLQKNRENTLAFQKNRSDRVSNSARCYLFSASLEEVGLRCIGHQKEPTKFAMPRMHHKFLVFLRMKEESDPGVADGEWPYHPYAVWTGSYNITKNGNSSLENALFIRNDDLAQAYCDEWAQLVEVSEPEVSPHF